MLSDVSVDDLVVVIATPEQWLETQAHNHASWGDGFTLEDYQRREQALCRDSDFGRVGEHTGWVLVPKNDPTTLEDIASSCETFERPIFIKDSNHPQGRVDKCFSICSVFTPVTNRKRGYAKRLLTLLHEKLAETAMLSVLYSDVGDYYSTVKREHHDPALATGWEIVGPNHVVWPAESYPESAASRLQGMAGDFGQLQEKDFSRVCERDVQLLQQEILASAIPSAFGILPSDEQLRWPIARCKFYDTFRHPASRYSHPFIDKWGCEYGQPDDPDWAFAIWSYDISENSLIILRMRCNSPKQLDAIVELAREAAIEQGMKTITAWNVDNSLLQGLESPGRKMERKEHLPAMAWYGQGPRPEWLCNENWAWV